MTPEVAAAASTPSAERSSTSAIGRFFSMENRYLVPMFITTILIIGQIFIWFSGKLVADVSGNRRSDANRTCSGTDDYPQVAEPRQRLHHGHQRRHSDSFAGVLAVRLVQRDRVDFEVRDSLEGEAPVESVELCHLRNVAAGAGIRRRVERAMGEHH